MSTLGNMYKNFTNDIYLFLDLLTQKIKINKINPKTDFILCINWFKTVSHLWNPLCLHRKHIVRGFKNNPIELFCYSTLYLVICFAFVVLIFKKNYIKKIAMFILSWLLIFNWCGAAFINSNYLIINKNLNTPLIWTNGVIFISFFLIFSIFYQLQKNEKKHPKFSEFLPIFTLLIVIFLQSFFINTLIRFILLEIFMSLIFVFFLNLKKPSLQLLLFLKKDDYCVRKLNYYFLLWLEFFNLFNATAPTWLHVCLNISIFFFYIHWFFLTLQISCRSSFINIFIISILNNLVLHINIISFILVCNLMYLQYFLFFFNFLFIIKISAGIWSIPFFAKERPRKITMFAPADKAPEIKSQFELKSHNSNIFFLNLNTQLLLFFIANFLVLFSSVTPQTLLILYLWIVVLSLVMHITAHQIYINIKTKDILDWRGIVLAAHQHQWSVKLVSMLTFTLIIFLTAHCIFNINNYIYQENWNLIIYIIFIVFNLLSLSTVFYIFVLWNTILAYRQETDQDYWTKEFWPQMSPYLRDYLYWLPVHGDEYEAPLPFYVGFQFKRSIYRLLWLCFFIFFFFFLTSSIDLHKHINFFKLFTFFLILLLYLAYTTFRNELPNDNPYLRDYVYYETQVFIVVILMSITAFWFVLSFTKYWFFWVIIYWIISF